MIISCSANRWFSATANAADKPGTIDGHIAGRNHKIGMLVSDPRRKRRPIVDEIWLVPAQMRVGDLNNSQQRPLRSNPNFADNNI
jgi:hypothetical protein